MIEIEKGVPVPAEGQYKGKYPWASMEVGDSFYVPNNPKMDAQAFTRGIKDGRKYITRREGQGVRVWRIE